MTKDKKLKYALYKYSSRNIGDEIQSIAARQFLPKVDYYIDRDKVGEWNDNKSSEIVKLIANGWYMSNPMEWPISNTALKPLLTSIHINDTDEKVVERFSSSDSVRYLKYNGPVGARDKTTQKIFNNLGIRSDLSACLTLTLQRDPNIKKMGHILCVTVSDELYEAVKSNTNRPVIRIDTTTFDSNLATVEKFKLAEQFLYLYQSAHFVITSRLHAALPSLALETPIMYIVDSGASTYDPSRLHGLKDLTNNSSEAEFIANITSNSLENPKNNPKKYLEYREKLINDCEKFIGSSRANTFAILNDFSDFHLETSELFKTIIYNYDQEVYTKKQIIEYQNQEIIRLMGVKAAARRLTGNIKRRIVKKIKNEN